MDKKKLGILIGVSAILIILILGVLLGTGKGKVITLKDNETGYTTTFKCPNSKGFETIEEDQDEGKYAEIIVENKDKNIQLEMYYYDESKSLYDSEQQNRKENDEGYKEYTWNNYKAYIYSVDDHSLYFNVYLQDETEESNSVCLFGSVEAIEYDEGNFFKSFESNDVQKFLNSMEFKIEK